MKLLSRFFLGFVFFTLLAFSFSPLSFATNEFITSYKATYQAQTSGIMQVTYEISLTNRFSNIYATSYSLTLEGQEPENISAKDNRGPLVIKTREDQKGTTLTLEFGEEVVGVGKTLQFNLSYQTKDLIHQTGQIWEITIPKLTNASEIDNFSLTLEVPKKFGTSAYISPKPTQESQEGNFQTFLFSKEKIASSGIVAAFGEFQIFNFDLSYHLSNPESFRTRTSIALPPDTSYQQVSYEEISPRPKMIEVDNDGNWLAIYLLSPQEKTEVKARGQVKIFAQPTASKDIRLESYLSSQPFWEADDPKIKEIATILKTPQAIYDFVIKTLTYDYSRVREGAKRMGASLALKNPDRAICMEFTDLFIALSRAAGIPARELNGFAYTTNPQLQPLSLVQDVLHSWPEYWDEKEGVWVQIDPTWGATTGGVDYFSKLDLGHFVFAIHGEDSRFPAPAGSYKKEGERRKDVNIDFGHYQEPKIGLQVRFELPEQIFSEVKTTGKIFLENSGGEAIYNLPLEIKADKNLKIISQSMTLVPVIPPFSSQEISLTLSSTGLPLKRKSQIILITKGQTFYHNLTVSSAFLTRILPTFGLLLGIVIIFLLFKKIRIYQKRER